MSVIIRPSAEVKSMVLPRTGISRTLRALSSSITRIRSGRLRRKRFDVHAITASISPACAMARMRSNSGR